MTTNIDRELADNELGDEKLEQVAGGVHEAKAGSWLGTNKSVTNIPPAK